jgi:hypothetical protein
MLASIVDGGALLQVVWVSVVATVGVSLVFSLSIATAARASQQRRAGRAGVATAWGVTSVLCGVLCATAAVLGVISMLAK